MRRLGPFHVEDRPPRHQPTTSTTATLSTTTSTTRPTIIPELFWCGRKGQVLGKALQINAAQIMSYLDTYRSSASGGELDEAWASIQLAWSAAETSGVHGEAKLITLMNFNRVALAACRAMWAQFNPLLMAFGLLLISFGICATWAIYSGFSRSKDKWKSWVPGRLSAAGQGAVGGAILGAVGHIGLATYMPGVSSVDAALFGATLVSSISFIISSPPNISLGAIKSTPMILILHAIAFLSNSFTFWELGGQDRSFLPYHFSSPLHSGRIECHEYAAPISHSRIFLPFRHLRPSHLNQHHL